MFLHVMLSLQVFLLQPAAPHADLKTNGTTASAQAQTIATDHAAEDFSTMIQRYTAYNHWANQQLAAWLRTADEADLDRNIESSFSTLKETIYHIWNAEYLWLQTVKGLPSDDAPSKSFKGTKDEMLDAWLEASANFSAHVNSMTLEQLQEKRPKSRGDGHMLIIDMIHHCMNHSTYHRGQLITMGRQAGLTDPPRTDFIYYVGLPKD